MDRARNIGALRQALASLGSEAQTGQHGLISLGAVPVDAALGGGLARGAVHEIFAPRTADFPAAAGFATGLFLRQTEAKKAPLVWVRERHVQAETGMVFAPGLAQMGVDAAAMVLVLANNTAQALRAGHEALRCAGLGAVVIELWGPSRHFDATASRRLSLAANQSGVTAFMVRTRADPGPSSAATRWQITSTVSKGPLNLPGPTSLAVSLLRQRNSGIQGEWILEFDHANRAFSIPTLSGAVATAFADRPSRPDSGTSWAQTG